MARSLNSPLGVEDPEEGGPAPVGARQGEDGPQVVEGDVALGEAALQTRLLEGGPLLLQSPGASQVPLREDGAAPLNTSLIGADVPAPWWPTAELSRLEMDLESTINSLFSCRNGVFLI